MGPMTGRGMGFCARVATPVDAFPARGFGMGCGRGRGGGWRNMFRSTGLPGWQRGATSRWPSTGGVPPVAEPTDEQKRAALRIQAEYFENALGEVRTRLQELEPRKADR